MDTVAANGGKCTVEQVVTARKDFPMLAEIRHAYEHHFVDLDPAPVAPK
jgi:hypothetical protein